jgi:hypothetical protein
LKNRKPNPVTAVANANSKITSNPPSPWSGEKPKYLSMKSTASFLKESHAFLRYHAM